MISILLFVPLSLFSFGVFVMRKALQEVESAESDEGSVSHVQSRSFFHFQFGSIPGGTTHQTHHRRAGACTTCSNPTFEQCAGLEMQYLLREKNEKNAMESKMHQLKTQLMDPMNQALMKQRKWIEAKMCQTLGNITSGPSNLTPSTRR